MMLDIATFQIDDLSFALELSARAGWNQTSEDWQRFLSLSPHGCFVARVDQQQVGTVTTCQLGGIGWIGMMLVDTAWRRRGIGRSLMCRALEYLTAAGSQTIRLDATELGEALYASLGFQRQFRLRRYAGTAPTGPVVPYTTELSGNELASLISFDRMVIGYDREPLLRRCGLPMSATAWCIVSLARFVVTSCVVQDGWRSMWDRAWQLRRSQDANCLSRC